jgi:SAM-dependent methyltransferase
MKKVKTWKLMSGKNDWFSVVLRSYENPPVVYKGQKLPRFPSDEIQINTTGQAGEKTLREAFVFYQDCASAFEKFGMPLNEQRKLLDFGSGWGRISRFFLHDMKKANLYGVDVTRDFVEICRDTFDSENFVNCQAYPPTEFSDETFDYVVGYSVFSHLSEGACRKWMEEFHRLLKPGGLVAVTTRGRPFFDYCENLRNTDVTGYSHALAYMFDDFTLAREKYDRGMIVHSNADGVTGGGAMDKRFYGETFIPEAYAQTAYSDLFTFKEFLFDRKRQTHPILFFQRLD